MSEKYPMKYAIIITGYDYVPGYLDFVFDKLEKEKIATRGFDGNHRSIMEILDDGIDPFIIVKKENLEKANNILKENCVLCERILEFNDFNWLEQIINKRIVHEDIQKERNVLDGPYGYGLNNN